MFLFEVAKEKIYKPQSYNREKQFSQKALLDYYWIDNKSIIFPEHRTSTFLNKT